MSLRKILSVLILSALLITILPSSISSTIYGSTAEISEKDAEDLYLVWSKDFDGKVLRDYGEMKIVYSSEKELLKKRILYHPAGYMKYLKIGESSFDPLVETPKIPREFLNINTKLTIVQFLGPPSEEDISELNRIGKILFYVPHNAYLVYTENPRAISELKNVRWYGKYHPYYKIDPAIYGEYIKNLVDRATLYSEDMSVRGQFIPTTIITFGKPFKNRNFKEIRHFVYEDKFFYYGFLNINSLKEISRDDSVLYIGKYNEPKLYDELSTEIVSGFYPKFGSLIHRNLLTGYGVVVAIADTGIDTGSRGITHPDLKDRVIAIWDASGGDGHDGYGHGTHCAGIIAGDASLRFLDYSSSVDSIGYYYGLGVAPKAKIVSEKIFSDSGMWLGADPFELAVFAQINGAVISSNSWGADVQGAYDDFSMIYDILTRDSNPNIPGEQQILYVFAAGNSGPASGTVGSPATAKNVITVGACENNRFGGSYMNLADFSSRGPTKDDRIKPDVVAPGTWVASALSQSAMAGWGWGNINRWYEWCGGTSMATPHVAGAAAIFVQYYKGIYGKNPSPAMTKAALIVSAIDLNGTYTSEPIPNYNEGWGMIYLPNIINPPHGEILLDSPANLTVGSRYVYYVNVEDPSIPLKITMAYTDRESTPNTSPTLVNNLDLVVYDPLGNLYMGNVFRNGWSVPGVFAPDKINNVECVYIKNPVVGKYRIEVLAINIPMDSIPSTPSVDQDFAIAIIGGVDATLYYSAVEFEKDIYKPGDFASLMVFDYYANENPSARESVAVKLYTGVGDYEEILLSETERDSGIFAGRIYISAAAPVTQNGILEVSPTDRIKAIYIDYFGNQRSTEVDVDGVKPSVLDVIIESVGSTHAKIRVITSEKTIVKLYYGTETNNLNYFVQSGLNDVHLIKLRKLTPYTKYFFYVYAEDVAGNYVVVDNSTNYYRFRTSIPSDILLVADDGGQYKYSTALLEYVLEKIGLKFDVWDTVEDGEVNEYLLFTYSLVIWNCGPSYANTLSESDQLILSKYLDAGGRLLLLGQDILYDVGLTDFFLNYFYIYDYYEDVIMGYSTIVYGVNGNPITGNYTAGLTLQSTYFLWIDEILTSSPRASSIFIDTYGESIGIMVDSTYRAIFMTFPYECLVIGEESASIEITSKMISWLTYNMNDIITLYSKPKDWSEPNRTYVLDVLVVNKADVQNTINISLTVSKYDYPPIVGILRPRSNEILSGVAIVEVFAKDDNGISKIEIYVDNNLVSVIYTPPYVVQLNTNLYKNKKHTLKAVAYDTANQASSHEIEVAIFNVQQIDSYGYRSIQVPYLWIDVRGNSSSTFIGGGDDNAYSINLPFTFRYYESNFSSIFVCTNGFISLVRSTSLNNVELPTSNVKDIMAVYWDDLRSYDTGEGIYMLTTNIGGRKCVVIEWYIKRYDFMVGGVLNFEAIIFTDGEIIFSYNNTYIGDLLYDSGASATVGIQRADGSAGRYILISYDIPVIKNKTTIKFKPPWIPFLEYKDSVLSEEPRKKECTSENTVLSAAYQRNVTVTIPPKSAVWIRFDWKPTVEGTYSVKVVGETVANESVVFNNKIEYKLYVRKMKGSIRVGVIDSWLSDYYRYSLLQRLYSDWYVYGNYQIVFDIDKLNKEGLSIRDFINSGVNVLMISNAWSSKYGWEFDDVEINSIKAAVLMGHGIVATAGTLSSSVKKNMLLGPVFGIDTSLEGYWADIAYNLNIYNLTHPIFEDFPPTFRIGYSRVCTGLRVTTGNVMAETDVGLSTGKKGIMSLNAYGNSYAVYIPYMPEILYANEFDLKLLYNTIVYLYLASNPVAQDLIAINMQPQREWVEPGKTVDISFSVFNAGYLNTAGRIILRAIYDNYIQEIASLLVVIPPRSYYNATVEFVTSREGKITLVLEIQSSIDNTPDNNVILSHIYCRKMRDFILVAGVDSLGAKFPEIMIWSELEKYWYRYGSYKIIFDMKTLVDKNITYDDINSTNADVLVISDAWRNIPSYNIWWEFNDIEIEAIKRYVKEGHGLIMTSGTLNTDYVPNNMKLAPLAGLSDKAPQRWHRIFSGIFNVNSTLIASKYIFDNVSSPYITNMAYTTYNWMINASDPAEILAKSTDRFAGIFFHKYGLGSVVYFSHIPEYYEGNEDDRQLVYNAIVYLYINSTQPIIDNNPPILDILNLQNGDILSGIIDILVSTRDYESYVVNVTIEIANSTDVIILYPGYNMMTSLYQISFDTSLLSDGRYLIRAISYDKFGNRAEKEIAVAIDNTPPTLNILYPTNNAIIYSNVVNVRWTAVDSHLDHIEISVDGSKFINIGMASNYTIYNLSKGMHVVVIKAIDSAALYTMRRVVFYVFAPGYSVLPMGLINDRAPLLSVRWENVTIVKADFYIDEIYIHSSLVNISRDLATAHTPFLLSDGIHYVKVILTEIYGNSSIVEWSFEVDATPPRITIITPPNGNLPLTYGLRAWINGTTEVGCKVYINGISIYVDNTGNFSQEVSLVEGLNIFNVEAVDKANNTAVVKVTILSLPTLARLSENITKMWSIVQWLNKTLQENVTIIYAKLYELERAIHENSTSLRENITRIESELYRIADYILSKIDNLSQDLYYQINRINGRLALIDKNVSYLRTELSRIWSALSENITALRKFLNENYSNILKIMDNISELINQLKEIAALVESLQAKDSTQDAGINLATALSVLAIIVVIVGLLAFLFKKKPGKPSSSAPESNRSSARSEAEDEDTITLDSGLAKDIPP